MRKFLCVCLVLALCIPLIACSQNQQFKLVIETDSMAPIFSAGDTVVYETVDAKSLEIGDVIAFWVVENGQRFVRVHRITEIYDGGENLIFQTKGDNNAQADANVVHESNILGKYVRKLIFGFL